VEAMKDLGEARGSLAKTQTWLTEESATVQRLRAQLDEARGHIAALLIVTRAASVMASAITAYFNKRGVAHSLKDGNEDIMELGESLAEFGPLEAIPVPAARAFLRGA
jgi:hypothetical protein